MYQNNDERDRVRSVRNPPYSPLLRGRIVKVWVRKELL